LCISLPGNYFLHLQKYNLCGKDNNIKASNSFPQINNGY
jgi:hypothetical protein